MLKLITGRGGGGGTGSEEASWGTSGRAHHRAGVDEHGHSSESGRVQPLKRIDPESHALALRRGSDGAELVKEDLAAAASAPMN